MTGLTNPADRIRAALIGEIIDAPPVTFWTHFPHLDRDPAALARETIRFRNALDLDLVKSMPNGFYCVEDWGVVVDASDVATGGVARAVHSPVKRREDWSKIRRLKVDTGAMGRELDHLARLVAALGREVPVLATVFSPVTIAKKIAELPFREAMTEAPQVAHDVLGEIAATTAAFARAAVEIGCAGLFLAVQDATPDFGADAYATFGTPYDIQVLAAAEKAWCNTVHMHGEAILFESLASYPVHCLNWHLGEAAPSLAEYRRSGGAMPILGGLRRMAITRRDRAAIGEDLGALRACEGGRGIIISPGCVIRHPVDEALLGDIVKAVRQPQQRWELSESPVQRE